MPINSDLNRLIQISGARPLSAAADNYCFEGVEFDSREVKAGQLFIALPGEKNHGNSFVKQALINGAALVLADSREALDVEGQEDRILLVSDPLAAFWQIAAWWRKELNLPTLAITGSVGKTTCKEMAASILLQYGPGSYSLKSYNNHVGVPYSICRSSTEHKWMILELGMNHRGEIAGLSKLANPDVAAICSIAPAHIGNLGSLELIAEEKLDIIRGLKSGGSLVIDSRSEVLIDKARELAGSEGFSLQLFGQQGPGEGAFSEIHSIGLKGISFNLWLDSAWHEVSMNVLGRQNASNAACVSRACRLLLPELKPGQIVSGLAAFAPPSMRLNLKFLSSGSVVIDDSYNANPASMAAAIDMVFDAANNQQRVGLVIGDMLELGSFSESYHKEISALVFKNKPDFLIAVGDQARFYLKQTETRSDLADLNKFRHFNDLSAAKEFLLKQEFDILLVKASRGVKLDLLVRALLDRDAGSAELRSASNNQS